MMNQFLSYISAVSMASLSVSMSSAIDRPINSVNTQSPLAQEQAQSKAQELNQLKPIPSRANKLWLGIVPGKVPAVLLAQLELSGNSGVVAEGIAPGSPAQKAGIKDMDIILRVADKPISEANDLLLSIQDKKAGDKVPVELLRGGKNQTLMVELEEGKGKFGALSPYSGNNANNIPNRINRAIGAGSIPLPMDDDISNDPAFEMLSRMMSQMNGGNAAGAVPSNQQAADAITDMRQKMAQRMANAMKLPNVPTDTTTHQSTSVMRISDGDGRIILMDHGDGARVEVYDRNDKLLYEGPYATDEDKAAVPPEVKDRLRKIRVQTKN
ncbi:MAG: PDZ domain-containing protein [Akkermansia sp.]